MRVFLVVDGVERNLKSVRSRESLERVTEIKILDGVWRAEDYYRGQETLSMIKHRVRLTVAALDTFNEAMMFETLQNLQGKVGDAHISIQTHQIEAMVGFLENNTFDTLELTVCGERAWDSLLLAMQSVRAKHLKINPPKSAFRLTQFMHCMNMLPKMTFELTELPQPKREGQMSFSCTLLLLQLCAVVAWVLFGE